MHDEDLVIESLDGTPLSASRIGTGPPLVLVHGGILGREAWQFVAPLLAERHTVWTYDRRGHGDSPLGSELVLSRELEDLAAVTGEAGSEVHLVGHSVGASLCMEAAVRQVGLRSMVLYEPPVHFDRMATIFRRATGLLERRDVEGFLDLFLTQVALVTAEELALLRSVPETWAPFVDGARRYAQHSDAFASSIDASIATGWRPESYRSVTAPTLLLVGSLTRSRLFATPDEVRDAVPHAELGTLHGQRHMAAAFDPNGFARAVLAFSTTH